MPAERLFGPIFTTDAMEEAVADTAWVQGMLDFEAALAGAEATLGLIPADAAEAIASCCDFRRFDVASLGREAVAAANPALPLVRELTSMLPEEARAHAHWGATSQDVLDTATMLVARRGLDLVLTDLDAVAAACARLVAEHRSTLMPGRTLLQQALPITFGLKAAGWLSATLEVRDWLVQYRSTRLAVQLGGAAGTLAALKDRGLEVSDELSRRLQLGQPVLPWHTARARVAQLGAVLALVAGTMEKIALDIALMMQTEVAEVAEPAAPGRGASSTLPQKRNPVGAAVVEACARGVRAQAMLLLGAMGQEHERSAGAWHSEWTAVAEAFRLAAGAVARTREMLEGLEVHVDRMRGNVDLTRGLLMAEHVMMALAERTGRARAHGIVEDAARRAATSGEDFRKVLLADPTVTEHLGATEIDAALEPAGYLGSTAQLIDRVLDLYGQQAKVTG